MARQGNRWMWVMAGIVMMMAAPLRGQDAAMKAAVEADWAAQEKRLGRKVHSPEAIGAAIQRVEMLWEDLRGMRGVGDLSKDQVALGQLKKEAEKVQALETEPAAELYRKIRWAGRDLALKNPLLGGNRIAFMERRRFVCQMLHEYLGYFHDGIEGGGVYVLQNPGKSFEVKDLIGGRLPKGLYTTLAMSYDAKTIYFAFAEADKPKGSVYSPQPGDRLFHIFAMDADGGNLRQITSGAVDDFDPCPLPDGGMAFMSSRRSGGFTRCNNDWEPIMTYTLHRMDGEGKNIRTLSRHETNEWHPSVLNDGRIVYIRWDYVDRSAAHHHGLWICNPDGTAVMSLFGNYTKRINACYQPRAIPGSNKILFVAGAHHADVGGSLVMLDPEKVRLDERSGEDRFEAVEVLTPEVCFPEAPDFPKSYFHGPWPLSEKYFLVGFGFEPLPRMGGSKKEATGIYYFDRFGNLELLYRQEGIACMYPIPLANRAKPPVVPSLVNADWGDEGEFVLSDVKQSLFPMPSDRPIRQLRVFQVLPKSTHEANNPRIGHANAESARMFLGTVPVEADGSAYFRAPARKPLYFQAVDADGKAVQSMRSVTYLQPGERRACVGCHEQQGTAAPTKQLMALKRPASALGPGPDGSRPFNYVRLVQPVLDRSCVRCHDGTVGEGKSLLALTGEATKQFTRSYDSLRPFLRWYEWGDASITQIATVPGRIGADESRLLKILEDPVHKGQVKLAAEDRERLLIWLDGNVPFYGSYLADEQRAQKKGEAIAEPKMQ
jgi:hypothetical protein